jgi:hypothetical protein
MIDLTIKVIVATAGSCGFGAAAAREVLAAGGDASFAMQLALAPIGRIRAVEDAIP